MTQGKAEAVLSEAIAHHRAGRLAAAEDTYRAVLDLAPEHADALHLLGVTAYQRGRPADALEAIGRALALDPDFPQAHNNIALVLQALGHLDAAERHGLGAIALKPDYAEAHTNLGNILKDHGRLEEAETCHRRALELRPDYAEAMTNLGAVLEKRGQSAAAIARHREALALRPGLADAHNNLGISLQAIGRNEEAETCFERTLALDPDYPLAHWNRGLLRLAKGDLDAGWPEYAWRFQGPQMLKRRRPRVPEWRGEGLPGKRLLVWREQGVGDELMFASCYPDLIRHAETEGGRTVIECDRRLVPLFARSFPAAEVRAETGSRSHESIDPPDVDYHVAAGTLPALFRPGLDRFPARPSWLAADPARLERWRGRLAAFGDTLKVGIAWRSRDLSGPRAAAYTALKRWGPLLTQPGITFVRLQYDECDAEIRDAERRFGVTIQQWPDLDLKDDFEEVAALVSALDLVITGPTAVGELAAALGVATWRVGWTGDWSALGATARPWFPSQRLFLGRADDSLDDRIADAARTLEGLRLGGRAIPDRIGAATAHHQAGRLEPAMALYRRVLADEPDHPTALHLLGLACQQSGAADEAVTLIGRAVAVKPDYGAAHVNLGNALQDLGRWGDALAAYDRALALNAQAADAWTNRGNALERLGRFDAAAASHERALAFQPDFADAWANLGLAQTGQDRLAEAETALRRALSLRPGDVGALGNLAPVLRRLGRLKEAAACLMAVLAQRPDDARAYGDLGFVRQRQGDASAAEACYRHALTLDPDLATAHLHLGLLSLAHGRLEEGWAEYGWRFAADRRAAVRTLDRPEWRGEDIAGKRILVWREQGVGDEILFATGYPDLIRRAGAVVIECDPRLISLFARSFPAAEVRPAGTTEAAAVDVQVPAGTLARWLRPDLESFAVPAGRLTADPRRVAAWRERLAALPPGPRVGISWRSGLLSGDRTVSYTGLRQWRPILSRPGATFVTLQYGDTGAEIADIERRFGITLHRWPDLDLKDDFEGVAALVSALDLVITAPTAVGELAGALGVPTWRLSWRGDWTALGTQGRPWFPAMRTFLASDGDTLDDVIARAAAALP